MNSQSIRFILIAGIVLVGTFLFNSWQQDFASKNKAVSTVMTEGTSKEIPQIPETSATLQNKQAENQATQEIPKIGEIKGANGEELISAAIPQNRQVQVKTDVLVLTIDTLGGDIVELDLPKFTDERDPERKGYQLMDNSGKHYYVAQSGLAGDQGPDIRGVGRGKFTALKSTYEIAQGEDAITVDLKLVNSRNVEIIKRFVFQRSSYLIDVEYIINNKGKTDYLANFYARLNRKPAPDSGGGFLGFGIQTFTGAAVNTIETPYKKFTFKDIEQKPFEQEVKGGWAAMVEHYFVSAWVPTNETLNNYQTKTLDKDIFSVGFVSPTTVIKPGEEGRVGARLYAGPEVTDILEKVAPGLELTVDYGILWPLCKPIFWLLKKLYLLTGNWGWSIVLITLIIKILFYHLSASSYRSMGAMRKLQPKMQALKERHADDKQKYSQSIMELYKKEKINPLGGCLPVVVQIPVFIALYYVLLGSVELREAPFILWITDLSAKDPYYVLPILMGITMLIQQKISPAPPDPMQAKVMMIMPIFFTVLFLNFPAGLVLYWFVNSVLSITQQWFITRSVERSPNESGAK